MKKQLSTPTDSITPKVTLLGVPVYTSIQAPKNKIWFIKSKKVKDHIGH